jgi:cytochrome c-type biogenesis protein CcmE
MRFIFVPIVILAGAGFLIAKSLVEAQVHYFHLDQFLAQKESLRGRPVQISGTVRPGTIRKDVTARRVSFTIEDRKSGGALDVVYPALTLPDTFKDEAQVTAQGKLPAGAAVFEAFEGGVAAKCPSKYEADQAEKAEKP